MSGDLHEVNVEGGACVPASCVARVLAVLLLAICFADQRAGNAAIPAGESQALKNLYNATNGDSWTANTNWCSGACPPSGTPTFNSAGSECAWFGITCDSAQSHVVAVALADNHLTGTLPAISALPQLQYFSVASNQLSGSLPALSSLSALRIFYASGNAFSGLIPAITGLANLGDFAVHGNQFSGSLPTLAGLTRLYSFDAANNQLSGAIPAISGLTNLRVFEVGGNQLTGSIPAQSGLTTLLHFGVERNLLSGSIPTLAPNLYTLTAGSNRMTGAVPAAPESLYSPLAFAPSELCPNPLSTSVSANDAGWNAATGFTPWYAAPFAGNRCDDLYHSSFE